MKKAAAIKEMKVLNLKELRSFLGACNFFRRHIPNFSASSHVLTDLTKKGVVWRWTDKEESHFKELKEKLGSVRALGEPREGGEILMVTDASKVGGGAALYQWQKLDKAQAESIGRVLGVNNDGTVQIVCEADEKLVPLGYFNWRWNDARKK